MSFSLDARLSRDTDFIGDLPLCRVLMTNDSRWPWLVLVPRRENLVELTDLDAADRALLIEEAASRRAGSSAMRGPTRSTSARSATSCVSCKCM